MHFNHTTCVLQQQHDALYVYDASADMELHNRCTDKQLDYTCTNVNDYHTQPHDYDFYAVSN